MDDQSRDLIIKFGTEILYELELMKYRKGEKKIRDQTVFMCNVFALTSSRACSEAALGECPAWLKERHEKAKRDFIDSISCPDSSPVAEEKDIGE